METVCGECNKEYSKKCEIKRRCTVHNRNCFHCLQCKAQPSGSIQPNLNICFTCKEPCKSEDAFYEWRCDTYFCKNQFTQCDFSKELITLPCSCQQQKGQVVAFMSSFCISCLRKLKDPDINQIRLCAPCINKNERTSTQLTHKPTPKPVQEKNNRYSLAFWLKALKPIQEESLEKEPTEEKKKQISQASTNRNKDQNLIIEILNQDIKKSEEQFKISQFTRLQLRKALFTAERDRQCIICNQAYTLANKPMMICMQQHLICETCFRQKVTLVDCPLCKEPIPKSKVRVSRERVRTLQLQKIMSEKYDTKHKRYLAYCENNFQKLRYQFEVNDAQIQTQEQIPKPVMKQQPIQQPVSKKKENYLEKMKGGRKRQKL